MTLRTRLADTLARSSTTPSLLVVTDSYVGATFAADVVCGPTSLSAVLGGAVEGALPEPTESHS